MRAEADVQDADAANAQAPDVTPEDPVAAPAHVTAPDGPAARERNVGKAAARRARNAAGGRPRRPSLGGGIPAQERELGAQGRQTVRRLLEAGLAEFDERGFQEVWGDGLQLLFRLAEAITQGMTASNRAVSGAGAGSGEPPEHAELTAVACLMMLERVNYLLSVEVRLPREEMVDRLSAIIFAAFHTA